VVKRALSIRTRLTLVIFASVLVTLSVALALIATFEIRSLRRAVVSETSLLAAMVSDYAAVDMAFDDRTEATRTLETLAKVPDVVHATLYDVRGQKFATFRRPEAADTVIPESIVDVPVTTSFVGDEYIDAREPVAHDGVRYGTLQLRASTATLRERTRAYLVGAAVVTAVIAALALAFAVLLQRTISRPILELTQVARTVAEKGDYAVRAPAHRGDELGVLAAAFNVMLAEVKRRQNEAEAAIQVRDDFLSVASHEFYTPLTSLKLSLQKLQSMPDAKIDDVQLRVVKIAAKQSDRLERLVTELLDVTRLRRGKIELALEDVDLAELIHEVADRFAPQLGRSGSELAITATTPLVGKWDRSRLDQVISNLMSNAVKFGEGKPIEIQANVVGETALLVVRDHGRGIPSAKLSRIFEPYERAVSVAHYGGLGLGLYISRSLVELHGGTIRAESVEGESATFIVELPLAGPPPATKEPVPAEVGDAR
jgi:signal transduction histidine kinase